MKIKYLGTAAAEGWPAVYCKCAACEKARTLGGKNIRTRSQVLIDDVMLVDYPPDTYYHSLQYNINLLDINNILITHSHQDHFYPLEFMLRCEGFCHGATADLNLYGNKKSLQFYNDAAATLDPFYSNTNGVKYNYIKPFEPIEIDGYTVTALPALHDRQEDCYIFHIEKGESSLLYGNDTGIFTDDVFDYLKGKPISLVSLDCTTLKHKDGTNHMGIEDVLIVKQRLIECGCVNENTRFVITHFSHNGELLHDEIEERVAKHDIAVAYDGFVFEF